MPAIAQLVLALSWTAIYPPFDQTLSATIEPANPQVGQAVTLTLESTDTCVLLDLVEVKKSVDAIDVEIPTSDVCLPVVYPPGQAPRKSMVLGVFPPGAHLVRYRYCGGLPPPPDDPTFGTCNIVGEEVFEVSLPVFANGFDPGPVDDQPDAP